MEKDTNNVMNNALNVILKLEPPKQRGGGDNIDKQDAIDNCSAAIDHLNKTTDMVNYPMKDLQIATLNLQILFLEKYEGFITRSDKEKIQTGTNTLEALLGKAKREKKGETTKGKKVLETISNVIKTNNE